MFDDPAATDHGLPLQTAAGLQDDLMVASHDLDRLRTLLRDACTVLMASFDSAQHQLGALEATLGAPAVAEARRQLGHAVTALQFEDMSSQLIAHTHRRLQACADRLAQQAMGDDGDGAAVVEAPPLRPNPVTQDEMDAGCVELF
jgi:hypothetical protein